MGEQLVPHSQTMTQTKYGYSVAIRHKDGKNNLYQIVLDEPIPLEGMTEWLTQLRAEVPTAQTILCSATHVSYQQPT